MRFEDEMAPNYCFYIYLSINVFNVNFVINMLFARNKCNNNSI